MTVEVNSNVTLRPSVIHKVWNISQPVSGILKQIQFLSACIKWSWQFTESDIADFLTNAAWAVRSTYHTVLKTSPGAAIFGRDMLFDVPFLADWNKIGEYRQKQTDKNTLNENKGRKDWDYQPGDIVLVIKDGILRKCESRYDSEPWNITSVHTNGTIRIQCGTKSERLNIRRVTPYFE